LNSAKKRKPLTSGAPFSRLKIFLALPPPSGKGRATRRTEEVGGYKLSSRNSLRNERDGFYYIIIQTYEVGLHSRRHPIEIDAGTRPFASFDAPIS